MTRLLARGGQSYLVWQWIWWLAATDLLFKQWTSSLFVTEDEEGNIV